MKPFDHLYRLVSIYISKLNKWSRAYIENSTRDFSVSTWSVVCLFVNIHLRQGKVDFIRQSGWLSFRKVRLPGFGFWTKYQVCFQARWMTGMSSFTSLVYYFPHLFLKGIKTTAENLICYNSRSSKICISIENIGFQG